GLLLDLAVEFDELLGKVEQPHDVGMRKARDPQQVALAENEGRFRRNVHQSRVIGPPAARGKVAFERSTADHRYGDTMHCYEPGQEQWAPPPTSCSTSRRPIRTSICLP